MNFEQAKSEFLNILSCLPEKEKNAFLSWCDTQSSADVNEAYFNLRTIAEEIKTAVYTDEIVPSECIDHSILIKDVKPHKGPVVHVDSFLYEDEHVDQLVEDDKLCRNFCKNCGCTDISPITFISHSASAQRLKYIFQYMLPDLKDKTVVDVGSRLGAVLYGAYYYNSAKKIIGVEINEDLCKLQKYIVDKYGLDDKIQIICDDICNVPEVIESANVIILNNVFQCFMPKEKQKNIWLWLKNTIKPQTLLVTVPSMEETLKTLETGINIDAWLEKLIIDPEVTKKIDDQDLLYETCLYTVK